MPYQAKGAARKRFRYKPPKGYKAQFEGDSQSAGKKQRLHKLAKKNTRYASRFPRSASSAPRSYKLSDKPLNYNRYLSEPYWQTLRSEILAERTCCERCGASGWLNLHHRRYYVAGVSVLYREREFPSVLEVLCYRCHTKEHGVAEFKRKQY